RIAVVNRTVERAEDVAELVRRTTDLREVTAVALEGPESREAVSGADVIVDCTSVGMYPRHNVEPVVPAEWLREGQVVTDLTYNPLDTVLLKAARAAGAQTVDGAGMLVHQGAISLQYWTGQEPQVETMRRALL
ncbi:MAG TPA: shikimate dehydrogenase, partial [Armatimonadetes bacterium]|nr:shikimate dehydrogenase [Armatimonadota bacterium]